MARPCGDGCAQQRPSVGPPGASYAGGGRELLADEDNGKIPRDFWFDEGLQQWNRSPSKKVKGFAQPLGPHQHWQIDVAYLNICGTFYYLCSILDGFSRAIVHWESAKR